MGTFTSLELLHSPHERDSEFRQSPVTDRQAVCAPCRAVDQRRFLAAELALQPPAGVSRHSLSLQFTANSTALPGAALAWPAWTEPSAGQCAPLGPSGNPRDRRWCAARAHARISAAARTVAAKSRHGVAVFRPVSTAHPTPDVVTN